jgi:sortase A
MNPTTTSGTADPAEPTDPAASPPKRRSRGRTITLVVGLALVLGGLSVLGYVGWQYWGTNWVAKGKQADLRDEIHARWEYPTVSDVVGPAAASNQLGSADALVRIPRFGSDYEVPMVEGVRDSDLVKGIGHFPGTGPGQIGNFALAAHRVTNGEPFRQLPELRPGDEVIIETADATYTYELDTDPNDLEVPFTDDWVIASPPVPPEGASVPPGMPTFEDGLLTEAVITLTTCSELFHTDDRMIAFGHLTSTVPK